MTPIYTKSGHLLIQHGGIALAQIPVDGDPRQIVDYAKALLRGGFRYAGHAVADERGRKLQALAVCAAVWESFGQAKK